MPRSPEKNPHSPLKRSPSWPNAWFKEQALKHVILKMRLQSLSSPPSPPNESSDDPTISSNPTSLLSDELLLLILSKTHVSQYASNCLVCKRWLKIQGQFVRSVKLFDWNFLESGRLIHRFPNLTEVDLIPACIHSRRNSGILITHKLVSAYLDSRVSQKGLISPDDFLPPDVIDRGLRVLASGCPNLTKLALLTSTVEGLLVISDMCPTLQQLELHSCSDLSLRGISKCENVQILKLIGCIEGFYNSVITDIGLTILAHVCRRLVRLELVGCEGSYDGIKAIGQCCQMLEDLTLCDPRLDGGWLAALPFCGNLKALRLQSCKTIDSNPGQDEHLGACLTLEELHLKHCQMRDKNSVRALFLVCEPVRTISISDCWGLENDTFRAISICRRVKILDLEGCSLLAMESLEIVVFSWNELERLRVVSCNNIKDSEVSPAMASLFSVLKELKWRPDSRSSLSSELAEIGVGKRGGRFFKRG